MTAAPSLRSGHALVAGVMAGDRSRRADVSARPSDTAGRVKGTPKGSPDRSIDPAIDATEFEWQSAAAEPA